MIDSKSKFYLKVEFGIVTELAETIKHSQLVILLSVRYALIFMVS